MLSGLDNPVHLLIIFAIALLLLGPKRLPGIGRSLGSAIRDFRDSIGGKEEEPAEIEAKPGAEDEVVMRRREVEAAEASLAAAEAKAASPAGTETTDPPHR